MSVEVGEEGIPLDENRDSQYNQVLPGPHITGAWVEDGYADIYGNIISITEISDISKKFIPSLKEPVNSF